MSVNVQKKRRKPSACALQQADELETIQLTLNKWMCSVLTKLSHRRRLSHVSAARYELLKLDFPDDPCAYSWSIHCLLSL